MSTLAYIKEMVRREITEDDKFYQKFIYFFELRVPEESSRLGPFYFPLMLNPESIDLSEPFAVETTQTTGGGVFVEENGIIVRRLRIRGQTGFKPRKLKGNASMALYCVPPEKRSFDRNLKGFIVDAISGQKHFQYLQDAVFRTYADLKRDPESAENTRMFFHNPKDDEHWEVVPQDFTMTRSARRPVTYEYNIDLLVVGPASSESQDFSEDKSLLDSIKDTIRQVNNAIDLIKGAVNDITGVIAEAKAFLNSIDTIISNALSIIDACTNMISGISDLVELPAKMVQNVIDQVEGSIASFDAALDRLAATGEIYEDITTHCNESPVPTMVLKAVQDIGLGCSLLLMRPSIFETPLQSQLREIKAKQSLNTSASAEALSVAGLATSPTSFASITAMGTGLMPGDADRAKVEITPSGADIPAYTGLQQIVVSQGDSLASLAARYLGDARRWQELALINNLKAPFISGQAAADITEATDEEALPGALGVGKILLVPNYKRPPEARPLLPVIGVPAERGMEEQLLGSDLLLIKYPGAEPRYDVAINTSLGSADAKTVSGINNLRQAIEMRLVIEKGTDQLYKNVGLEPVVGLKWVALDKELVKFRVMKSVSADPRIMGIQKATLTSDINDPLDSISVEIEAAVLGFTEAATVKTLV